MSGAIVHWFVLSWCEWPRQHLMIIILVQAVSPQGRGDSIIGHFSGGFSKKISSKDYLSLCHFQFQNFQRQDSLYLFLFCASHSYTTPSLQTKTQFFLGWKSQPEICTISDSWLLIYITEKQKQWQYHWHARILSKKRNNIVFLMAAIS